MPSPFYFAVTSSSVQYFSYDGLVVIGTWLITKSLLLFIMCVLIHRCHKFLISKTQTSVTSLPCWGRVVIGSLLVYQSIGAGSIPVASTTVLTVSARSIGNDQKSCIRYAWEGLERSGPFPILTSDCVCLDLCFTYGREESYRSRFVLPLN
jgi:hypothetical protein